MIRSYFQNYSEKSTVHGVVYIGNPKCHVVEKIFWIISLFVSLVFTGLLIFELVEKLTKTPFVVLLDDTTVHVSEINFPAVTICPGLSVNVYNVDYTPFVNQIKSGERDLRNFTQTELERLQVISLITDDDFLSRFNTSIPTKNFMNRVDDLLNFFGVRTYDKVINAEDIRGNWSKQYQVNYTQVIGQRGLCFTFNFPQSKTYFKTSELSRDFNYNKTASTANRLFQRTPQLNYPVSTTKADLGLFVAIKLEMSQFIKINNTLKYSKFKALHEENGHHITIHDPYEIISKSSPNFYSLYNRTTLFKIIPNMMTYDDSIAAYTAEERQCYLPDEKSLKYFKVYNKINCEHECLANLTLKSCKCSQFWMVRSQSTPICGIIDRKCFKNVEDNFSPTKSNCKCLNTCQKLHYEVEANILDFHRQYIINTIFEVKFSNDDFYPFLYKRQYTNVEILAFVGGLLGLFAGLSALSVIEVIYFFSLRLLLNSCDAKVHPNSNQETRLTPVKKFWKNFMLESSIHSLNFIILENNKFKKMFWILAFVLSMYGFQSMASKSFSKFSLKAVSISQEISSIDTGDIDFPAITFTGEFQHSYHSLNYDYVYAHFIGSNFCYECYKNFSNISTMVEMMVCAEAPDLNIENFPYNYTRKSEFVEYLESNITDKAQKRWFGERIAKWRENTNPLYLESLTINGIGFTFNTFHAEELLEKSIVSDDFFRIQNSINNSSSPDEVPWKLSSIKNEFSISFSNNSFLIRSESNSVCKKAGFFIHSPYEIPLNVPYQSFTKIFYGTLMEVFIKPEVVRSDESILSMDLEHRKCYSNDEFKLKYFKRYTKSNCELEDLSDTTYEKCGCVPFNYIRNKTMDICDVSRWNCAIKFQNIIDVHNGNTEFSKRCLPLCNSVSYEYNIVTNRIANNFTDKYQEEVTLRFKFKESDVITFKRFELFPAVDFLCNIGGLLGLFAGVSFLTVIETLYCLIIRPLTDIFRRIF